MSELYISNICPWAPGVNTPEDWDLWKNNKKEIIPAKESPKLEFTDPLFRRRLSQISKMTVQVVHDLIQKNPEAANYKQVFVSFRGEIEREFTINEGIIEDTEIMPAGFSLSVFNTPIALATLSLKLKSGYSVIYPSKENFISALQGAVAPVLCGAEENIIFIYADEYVPSVYGKLQPAKNEPFAFATVISSKQNSNSVKLDEFSESPSEFLKKYL